MQTHDIQQGSPEWHDFRSTHDGASEAPAALGKSKYQSRTDLLAQKKTGLFAEVSDDKQFLFNKGHAAEIGGRAMAEKIVGEPFSPVVMSLYIDGLSLSASLDGITFGDDIIFEHKLYSESLAHQIMTNTLDEHYAIQLDQQLLVSGADKCLFMCSDGTDANMAYCWYEPDQDKFVSLIAGWKQFHADLKNFTAQEYIPAPKADVQIELPALFVHAQGHITDSNMKAYGEALTAKLAEVRAIALVTDQDFANAKAAAALFREQCEKLQITKEAMLSQTVSIGEAARMMDAWHEDLRQTALQLEKNVEREDLAKKRTMVSETALAYAAHIEALEADTRPIQLNIKRTDFALTLKGKRNYASMQSALNDALAAGKIEADAVAKETRLRLAWFKDAAKGYEFLFPDLQQLVFI